jgi:hypothetical protein
MRSGWVGVALMCIMLIFLFPAGNGPFAATHGPATALRAKQAAALLLLGLTILVAAILPVARGAILSLCHLPVAALPHPSATQNSVSAPLTCVWLC